MKCFMMTWGMKTGQPMPTVKEITTAIDAIAEISNWRLSTGALFLVSDQEARQLAERIHMSLPNLRFIVAPISVDDLGGWTERPTWEFVRHPKSVDDE